MSAIEILENRINQCQKEFSYFLDNYHDMPTNIREKLEKVVAYLKEKN